MHIYIADNAGVLSGPVELPVIPGIGIQVPSNAVQLAALLDESVAGSVWALVNGLPQQLPDHRGTVYRTDTGAAEQHAALGSLPEGLTTEPRPSADHSWSGNSWDFDAALQAANRLALSVSLCQSVDATADAARHTVSGDPLRAEEYKVAAEEAAAFAAANYQGDPPRAVMAWVIGGRTPEQAAQSILAEAAAYKESFYQLRETRLAAKENIRSLMNAGQVEQAKAVATQTIAAIEAAVAGIGNNAS